MTQELTEIDDGSGGELLSPGPLPLTPREEAFYRFYGDPESPHYSRPTAAAVAAGYAEKSAWNTAWKLRKRPAVQARLAVFQKAAFALAGKVLTDLENTRLLALAKSDLATAAACSKLQGQHLAMWTDVLDIGESEESVARYERRRNADLHIVEALILADDPPALPEARPEAEQEQEPQAPQTRQESE